MNLTSPFLRGAVEAATGLPSYPPPTVLKAVASAAGLFADDGPDGALSILMSGLAGVAAALVVAIVLVVYFRSGYRSTRDMFRQGLATLLVFGLLGFLAYDFRHVAFAYLGINPPRPIQFDLRLPKSAASAVDVAISGNARADAHHLL